MYTDLKENWIFLCWYDINIWEFVKSWYSFCNRNMTYIFFDKDPLNFVSILYYPLTCINDSSNYSSSTPVIYYGHSLKQFPKIVLIPVVLHSLSEWSCCTDLCYTYWQREGIMSSEALNETFNVKHLQDVLSFMSFTGKWSRKQIQKESSYLFTILLSC